MDLRQLDPQTTALAAVAAALMLAVLLLLLWLHQRRFLRRYRFLLGGPRGEDLEKLLLRHADQLNGLQAELAALKTRVDAEATAARGHVQHVGIVRYQAFPDTGSDLSFSAAFLDGHRNGLVITSLFGRSETRIYGKPIRNGTSTYPLTHEEKAALARAQGDRQPQPEL